MAAGVWRTGGRSGLDGGALVADVGLDEWKRSVFPASGRSSEDFNGDNADPDNDGVANIVEYSLGRNPLEYEDDPVLEIEDVAYGSEDPGYDAVLSFKRRKNTKGAGLKLGISSDLTGAWSSDSGNVVSTEVEDNEDGVTETCNVRIRNPFASRDRMFIRMSVDRE